MADHDDKDAGQSPEDKPAVDAAALKAKLGLKTRERRQQAQKGAGAAPEAFEPSEEDLAEAMSKAEEAHARAGTPIEAFDPLGQHHTPLPGPLPGGPSTEHLEHPRTRMTPILVTIVVSALVGILLGQVLGRALSQRDQRDAYATLVKRKLDWFREAKTASGESTLDRIAGMRERIADAVSAIDALEAKGGDPLTLEKTLGDLVMDLQKFVADRAVLDPGGVMEDVMVIYTDDVMLEAIRFATRSQRFFDVASEAVLEAVTLLRLEKPSGSTQRVVMAKRVDREVPGLVEEDPEKVTKLPAGEGVWVSDTGKPAEVKLVDPTTGNSRMEWQQMVLPVGEKDPVQVPTTQVLTLDVSSIYEEQGTVVRLLRVNRLAAIARQLDKVAGPLLWGELEKKMVAWAQKADE